MFHQIPKDFTIAGKMQRKHNENTKIKPHLQCQQKCTKEHQKVMMELDGIFCFPVFPESPTSSSQISQQKSTGWEVDSPSAGVYINP